MYNRVAISHDFGKRLSRPVWIAISGRTIWPANQRFLFAFAGSGSGHTNANLVFAKILNE